MIADDVRARIRRLFYAEHWKVHTISRELGVHHDTVELALCLQRFANHRFGSSPQKLDPYRRFITDTLGQYPRLTATRLFHMLLERGYEGSAGTLRRYVKRVRPLPRHEAFFRLTTLPGEQANRLGLLRQDSDWPRPAQPVVLRDGLVLVARHLRALHPGPDPREFSALPCRGLPGVRGSAAGMPVRQLEECGARAAG